MITDRNTLLSKKSIQFLEFLVQFSYIEAEKLFEIISTRCYEGKFIPVLYIKQTHCRYETAHFMKENRSFFTCHMKLSTLKFRSAVLIVMHNHIRT